MGIKKHIIGKDAENHVLLVNIFLNKKPPKPGSACLRTLNIYVRGRKSQRVILSLSNVTSSISSPEDGASC